MGNDEEKKFKNSKFFEESTPSGDDLRSRWKSVDSRLKFDNEEDEIFSLWEDQKKMRAEDKKLLKELREAKLKARQIKQTLVKNQFGDAQSDFFEKVNNLLDRLLELCKVAKLFVFKHKKYAAAMTIFIVLLTGVFINSLSSNKTQTLGDSITTNSNEVSADGDRSSSDQLPREKPDFDLLYPAGKSVSDYDVVRISPEGNAPSYTYIDQIPTGTETTNAFKVTQQKIPPAFDLQKVAESFQATNIIQVDENQIFHGFSEKTKIQSLLFIKKDKFILIASPEKLSDEQWASYILSLQ